MSIHESQGRSAKAPRLSKRESAHAATKVRLDPRSVLNLSVQEHIGDLHKQITHFYQNYPIPASQGRARVVSAKTTTKYVQATHMLVETLQGQGVKLRSVNELTSRQFLSVMRNWESKGMASSSLATYFSVLKRFYSWVGVKLPFASVHEVLKDPERGKRSMSATKSLAWSTNGVDFKSVLQKVHDEDSLVALQLEMVAAFGLRVAESCAMRPIECDRGNHLAITYGSKGGRGRQVDIKSQYQRDVLDKAKGFAEKHNGFLRTNRYTQKQAVRRFYYILECAGVTKSGEGISAHGLRHEYANDIYTQMTGEAAPVNHGKKVAKQQDLEARKQITESLGHSRIAITSAYLGSHVQMDRQNKKRLANLNATLTQAGTSLHVQLMAIEHSAHEIDPGAEARVFVTGPAADGKDIQGVPIVITCGLFSASGHPSSASLEDSQLVKLATYCQELLGVWCIGQHDKNVPQEVPRFELIYAS